MPRVRTSIDPIRHSLWLALGLWTACGDDGKATDSASGASSTGAPATSGGSTGPTSTGEEPPTTGATTTSGATGSGTTEMVATTTGASTTTTTAGTTDATTTATTGATTEADTGTTGEPPPRCEPLMQGDVDPPTPSGWVECPGKLPHRVAAEVCLAPATPSNCDIDEPMQECHTNADCDAQPFGSCQKFTLQLFTCGCVYGCETDADCAPGTVCRCAGDVLGPATRCVPSACADDDDCEGDAVCQFSHAEGVDCGLEVVNGACTTEGDQCDADGPCGDLFCNFVDGAWQCGNMICGRPLLVDEHAVTAAPAARDDWRATIAAPATPDALRDRLADHWTRVALAEHASVASFARFILQLLTVGAPPDLVLQAQQALADEVEHARVAFALASLHGGRGVGPGPLPACAGPGPTDREAIVAAVIREACVGETLSALEVRESAARAQDPALARSLTRIADDEQRHAELGWRFVQWALTGADAAARARAQAVFAAAIAGAAAAADALADAPDEPALRPHGVVDAPLRAAVWRRGLDALVRPSAAAITAIAC